MAQWDLNQYEKFKNQRAKPFWDLARLIVPGDDLKTMIDLGCGSGELTSQLHTQLHLQQTIGMDSSKEMLEKADQFKKPGLNFTVADIKTYQPEHKVDLVFSNAALQWVPNHPALFKQITDILKPHGQLAVQMPFNFDHPSHQIAQHLGHTVFKNKMLDEEREIPMLKIEEYTELLYSLGFDDPIVRVQVYPHSMKSGHDVIEWVKGTLLTDFKKKMKPDDFSLFLQQYTEQLLKQIGHGPYLYCFKRILMWGRRS